jgi:hypothetical protein
MRHRTVIALAELQTALHEDYRDAVASRGLLEAELASAKHQVVRVWRNLLRSARHP